MLKKLLMKYGKHISAFALLVGVVSTSAACRWVMHQPEVPEKMKELMEQK